MWSEIPTYEDYFPENATPGKNNTELKQQLKQSQLDLEQANKLMEGLKEYREKSYDRFVQLEKDKQELADALKGCAKNLKAATIELGWGTDDGAAEYKALAEKHLKQQLKG